MSIKHKYRHAGWETNSWEKESIYEISTPDEDNWFGYICFKMCVSTRDTGNRLRMTWIKKEGNTTIGSQS